MADDRADGYERDEDVLREATVLSDEEVGRALERMNVGKRVVRLGKEAVDGVGDFKDCGRVRFKLRSICNFSHAMGFLGKESTRLGDLFPFTLLSPFILKPLSSHPRGLS